MVDTKTLIERIFSKPTAPFREGWVLQEIEQILRENKIPFFRDAFGNLLAGSSSASGIGQRLILQAHTDHPGFHLKAQQSARKWSAVWYGGAPLKTMKGAAVRIYDPARAGWGCAARIGAIEDVDYTREGIPITLEVSEGGELHSQCFGSFDFPAHQFSDSRIETRAADDLAGVVIALGALIDQKKKGKLKSALAVFTRAEEVGFVGCLKLLSAKILRKGSWTLTLEASRALPLAESGMGPVLRIGDRSTVFNSDFSIWMWKVAENLQKQDSQFRYQRRLMDGGSCEATAFALHGMTTSGLAVPLINYHNQGENGPAPEMIHLHDVDWARQLCAALYDQFPKRPLNNKELRKSLHDNCRKLTPQLKEKIQFQMRGN